MIGDYPDLPAISAQEKSPYGWWDPQDRRNKEETVGLIAVTPLIRHKLIVCVLEGWKAV